MLSDEEKEAIEHLTKKMEYYKNKPLDTHVWLTLDEHYVRILLNLIEKQQKEIEELKFKYQARKDRMQKEIEELNKSDESKEQSSMNYYNLYKELVDKIKAKIEEVSNGTYDAKIVLQSLLEKE